MAKGAGGMARWGREGGEKKGERRITVRSDGTWRMVCNSELALSNGGVKHRRSPGERELRHLAQQRILADADLTDCSFEFKTVVQYETAVSSATSMTLDAC